MKIKTLILGSLQTNGYVISNDQKHCFIVDPGSNGKKVVNYLSENELQLDAIVLTHGHFDHIGAVDYLYERYHCPIYIHQEDIEMLNDPQLNLSIYEAPVMIKSPILPSLEHMEIAGFNLKWLHLPGHCPGSSMIFIENENVIFAGDVLFKGSIGRYDFQNSSKHDTLQSLDKIKMYEFDAMIYPGHGPITTLKDEQENNPYLKES